MHIELVDVLRCPRPHDDAWLVAGIDLLRDREIVRGTLGCPVCTTEYPVRDSIVRFRDDEPPSVRGFGDDAAIRAAAFLDLSEPGAYATLAGEWGAHAAAVAAMTDVRVIAINAPGTGSGNGAYGVWARDVLPLAAGSARGIALDAVHAPLAPVAVRALRAGGRLVAPAATPLPPETRELARDADWWVAERLAAPQLVGLSRA